MPAWLSTTGVPLFISDGRLRDTKNKFHRARGPWALDSGGFTEIKRNGAWTVTPEEYVDRVYLYAERIGMPDFAAGQDWMCEPFMTRKTGKTVYEHQVLTVENYLKLKTLAPDLPFIPTLQGWELGDYLKCFELYQEAGVDLASCPTVGVGSVCRRQHTDDIGRIMRELNDLGLRNLHGFGVKTAGLEKYAHLLQSADSMAWSITAYWDWKHTGYKASENCTSHKNCANCITYALKWRMNVLRSIGLNLQRAVLEGKL